MSGSTPTWSWSTAAPTRWQISHIALPWILGRRYIRTLHMAACACRSMPPGASNRTSRTCCRAAGRCSPSSCPTPPSCATDAARDVQCTFPQRSALVAYAKRMSAACTHATRMPRNNRTACATSSARAGGTLAMCDVARIHSEPRRPLRCCRGCASTSMCDESSRTTISGP